MQTPCSSYKMDMTDPTLGMEQRCKNCQLAKKLHTLTNSQPFPASGGGNKVSDLAKKFSSNQQPVAPNMQNSAHAFANALKMNVSQKKETNSNQQTNQPTNPPNPPVQTENQFKKTSSQIIQNDPTTESNSIQQPIHLERQNLQVIDSKQDARVQIETPPPQKVNNNIFLKQDKEMKESGRASTQGQIEHKQPFQPKPFGKQDEQQGVSLHQVPTEHTPKQQPVHQEPKQTPTNVVSKPQVQDTQQPKKITIPDKKEEVVVPQKIEEPKHPVQDHPVQDHTVQDHPIKTNPQTNGNTAVKEKAQNLMMFGFGAPPPKKVIEAKESESVIEERMISRPNMPKRHQRKTQEITFSDSD